MNNIQEQIKIQAKLTSNKFLLFSIWLLLIILPYLGMNTVSEAFLSEGEKRILSKAKMQLFDEINDYQRKLTTDYYIEHKLKSFPNTEYASSAFTADTLANSLSRHLKSNITALFYFNDENEKLDAYIYPELKSELGMYSKTSIKGYMKSVVSQITDSQSIERNNAYFQKFLLAAGGITIIPEHATPILSGKSKLQKMTGYFKAFMTKDNKQNYMLFLVKNKDISIKEIIKTANQDSADELYIKSLEVSSGEQQESAYYKYEFDPSYGLSIYSMLSEELVIRYITQDTYYPFNVDKFKSISPKIKITIPAKSLQHPMRETINNLKFPLLLLILLSSFALINISFFGYTGNIRILTRVIICISAAVLIPFTSFGLAAYYNYYYTQEYNKNEIQQYTQIQLKVIEKAIEAFISNKELSIADLRSSIINLSEEELVQKLKEWLPGSDAELISYCYNSNQENLITNKPNATLSPLSHDVKRIANFGLQKAFDKIDFSRINSYDKLEKSLNFSPEGMGRIITNIGKIYSSVAGEPNSLYSVFPIFTESSNETKPLGSILVKFEAENLLHVLRKRSGSLFSEKRMGKYSTKTAIFPLTENGLLQSLDKTIMTNGFPIDMVIEKANQLIISRTNHTWDMGDTVISGTYISKVNSIVFNVAELSGNALSDNSVDINKILIYTLLLILALSLLLGGIIITPLKQLKKTAEKVGQGDYTNKIQWKSRDEFETLSESFNEMADALLQKEKMTNYVSQDVINEISNSDMQLQPGGERIPVSILFCALKGEKELSQYPAETITSVIGKLVDAIDEISTDNKGQIDKLIEDTVMIVFRKTTSNDRLALNACRTALAINNKLKNQIPGFRLVMGIASGDAVSGKIGSRNGKLDYTVIGNPVNLAARLKVQAVKAQNTGILICPYTIRLLQGAGKLQFIERLTIKGRTNRTFPLYELLSLRRIDSVYGNQSADC